MNRKNDSLNNDQHDEDRADYDFSGLSDIDLVILQNQIRGTGDDDFLNAILKELGKRQRGG
jgi:hypothetical protein